MKRWTSKVCGLLAGVALTLAPLKTAKAEDQAAKLAPLDGLKLVALDADTFQPKEKPAERPATPKRRGLLGDFRFGLESYTGWSNLGGVSASVNDGVWAGNTRFYPSVVSLDWGKEEGDAARFAWGVGDLYTARDTLLRQPVEAYYSRKAGENAQWTFGKFFSPFAQQEWQYESKYGVMWSGSHGKSDYALALQMNELSQRPNLYARIGRQTSSRANVGVSFALGSGLSYGSSHAVALALDLAYDMGIADLNMEYNLALGSAGAFQFGSTRLTFKNLGRWSPYISIYSWRDAATELGAFRSGLVGVDYAVTPFLTLGTGVAKTAEGDVLWLQQRVKF